VPIEQENAGAERSEELKPEKRKIRIKATPVITIGALGGVRNSIRLLQVYQCKVKAELIVWQVPDV
jgi:hypothetical protein